MQQSSTPVLRTAVIVRQTVKRRCFLLTFLFKWLFCLALWCSGWQLLLCARVSSQLQMVYIKLLPFFDCPAERRHLSAGIKRPWPLEHGKKQDMLVFFCFGGGFFSFFSFSYPWLRRGGQRRRRFPRQCSPLLKRMRKGMCLMIHRPAPLHQPKWILRICSAL